MEILKRYFLKTPLFRWAFIEGAKDAFPKAQKDILETMRDDLDAQAEVLAQKKLDTLLSAVDTSMIVSVDKRTASLFIGGKQADAAQVANLKAEVAFLRESEIWPILYETPKELAQRALFIEGDDIERQGIKARAMLYLLDTQNKILDTLM